MRINLPLIGETTPISVGLVTAMAWSGLSLIHHPTSEVAEEQMAEASARVEGDCNVTLVGGAEFSGERNPFSARMKQILKPGKSSEIPCVQSALTQLGAPGTAFSLLGEERGSILECTQSGPYVERLGSGDIAVTLGVSCEPLGGLSIFSSTASQ